MPLATDDAQFLRLAFTPGIGARSAHALLSALREPAAVFSASVGTLTPVVGEAIARRLSAPPDVDIAERVDASLTWLAAHADQHLLTWSHPAYPRALLESGDAPIILFAKGRLELLQRPALAMVGSRNCSAGGSDTAEAFAQAFSEGGVTVVSGLALGIDAAAHTGALRATSATAGSTIAVVGTGIDRIYPARNKALTHSIAERGLLLSEYPLGTPPHAGNFPKRNRVISGLSRGVLVVEASMNSGSLITARLAGEQGREVFAIPGSIHSTFHKGCHHLIKQGAKLVETAQDVLDELRLDAPPALPVHGDLKRASPGVDAGVFAHIEHAPVDADTLVARSGLPVAQVMTELTLLELEGRVETLSDGRWQRRG
ncbi:MAG: DNA-protecting protein DprA [Burkholderiales bacterium]|nr:DNA-protecting protein DprA [Burkholderiales bacterium]